MSESRFKFEPLKAPFWAFGGKSRVADEVWARFGGVEDPPRNIVEPFAFSSAVMLRRPGGAQGIETINDRNAFVSNFWRAVAHDPEAVARYADWPVNETDLHARHRWLVNSDKATAQLQKVRDSEDFFDPKIAGWWCWGACCWIGSGWCDEKEDPQRTHLFNGRGINAGGRKKMPRSDASGINRLTQQLPALSGRAGLFQYGWGVNAGAKLTEKMPHMDAAGRAVLSPPEADSHRPQLADAFSRGRGVNGNDSASSVQSRREWITAWMFALADRMRSVRVCCGHWTRVCDSPSTMTRLGLTGVFLDPPYRVKLGDGSANRSKHIYANDRNQDLTQLCDEVQEWCLRWGQDPLARIALCGLEGEYPEIDALVGPGGWDCFAWKGHGGYGNRGGGKENVNAARERVWFSPACRNSPVAKEAGLFC